MTIDATFWVAISFILFIGLLVYFKIPQKVNEMLKDSPYSFEVKVVKESKIVEVI